MRRRDGAGRGRRRRPPAPGRRGRLPEQVGVRGREADGLSQHTFEVRRPAAQGLRGRAEHQRLRQRRQLQRAGERRAAGRRRRGFVELPAHDLHGSGLEVEDGGGGEVARRRGAIAGVGEPVEAQAVLGVGDAQLGGRLGGQQREPGVPGRPPGAEEQLLGGGSVGAASEAAQHQERLAGRLG